MLCVCMYRVCCDTRTYVRTCIHAYMHTCIHACIHMEGDREMPALLLCDYYCHDHALLLSLQIISVGDSYTIPYDDICHNVMH